MQADVRQVVTVQVKLGAWDNDAQCQSCGGLELQEFVEVYRDPPTLDTPPQYIVTMVQGQGVREMAHGGRRSARACECKQKQKAGEVAIRRAKATELVDDLTWETWNKNPAHPGRRTEIVAQSRTPPGTIMWTTLARWQPGDPPLYLYGEHGMGKTHALAAICRQLIYEHGVAALHRSLKHLLSQEQAGFNRGRETVSVLERAAEAPVLLLDDLGAERMTPWVAEVLYGLIDKRILGRRPTCIASNHEPDVLRQRLSTSMGTSKAEAEHIRENGVRIFTRLMERVQVFEFRRKI